MSEVDRDYIKNLWNEIKRLEFEISDLNYKVNTVKKSAVLEAIAFDGVMEFKTFQLIEELF